MKVYDKYQKTDVLWLENIPSHWTVSRLKFLAYKLKSGGTPKADNSSFYTSEGGTPWVAISDMSSVDYISDTEKHLTKAGIEDKNLQIYPAGTLLYSIYATLGKVAELKVPAAINQAILAISLRNNYLQSFCKYALKAQETYVLGLANSNTQANLNAEKVANYHMPVPPIEEQKAIADFLDVKTSELEAERQNILKQIDLLKELKHSVIVKLVTKGLQPHALMKESSIQWIGEIPAHWKISRFKYLVYKLRSGGTPKADNSSFYTTEGGTPWVAISDMSSVDYVNETEKYLTAAGLADKKLQIYPAGTLLYSIYATLGKVAELKIPAAINQAILAISLRPNYMQSYCKYTLKAQEQYVLGLANSNTQANLNAEKVANYYMPIPPIEEQKAIADFLDLKVAELDEQIELQEQQIRMIDELKQSIISQAVTGKIKVF